MKVILINPTFSLYGGIKGHGGNVIPLNLCCLAAYVRRLHPDVEFKIFDAEQRSVGHEKTVEETITFSLDLIGIATNTPVFDSVKRLTVLLKLQLPNILIIFRRTACFCFAREFLARK
jgi:hypothetical protein